MRWPDTCTKRSQASRSRLQKWLSGVHRDAPTCNLWREKAVIFSRRVAARLLLPWQPYCQLMID